MAMARIGDGAMGGLSEDLHQSEAGGVSIDVNDKGASGVDGDGDGEREGGPALNTPRNAALARSQHAMARARALLERVKSQS